MIAFSRNTACLSWSRPRDHRAWIGVGCRPARSPRDLTQIDGTRWLERRCAALRRVDFGYTGLEGAETRLQAGGWLEFTQLATGLWFVQRWALRVPSFGEPVATSARGTERVVLRGVPVLRVQGEVLDVAVDARAVFTAGATDVAQAGALVPRPLPIDTESPNCHLGQGVASVVASVRSASGVVLPEAARQLFWRDEGAADSAWQQASGTTRPTGHYHACALPPDRLLTLEVHAPGHEPAALLLRIGSPRAVARVNLVLPPASDPFAGTVR